MALAQIADKIRVVDTDAHIIEPEDLWTERLPEKFKDMAPKVEIFEKWNQLRWRFNNSRFYFTPFNSEAFDQEGYTIFNARLKYTAPDEQWYAAVYGRNLGDKLYRFALTQSAALFGTLDNWAPSRTYGIEVGPNSDKVGPCHVSQHKVTRFSPRV